MNTRIAQQVGTSFGIAIVAVVLQSLLGRSAASAFHGAFWWATGITVAALIPALALPAPSRSAGSRGRVDQVRRQPAGTTASQR
jgi:predicted cobalt transporter CbtA